MTMSYLDVFDHINQDLLNMPCVNQVVSTDINCFDVHTTLQWATKDPEKYERELFFIEGLRVDKIEYRILLSYDIRGFEYWMETLREPQYVNVSVTLSRQPFTKTNLEDLKKDIDWVIDELFYNLSQESLY